MKSIRLSLIVSFLLLLALALGAVGSLVWWNTAQIVQARKEATETLLKEQFNRRSDRERRRLDSALLYQARAVASLAQLQANQHYFPALEPLGLLGACLAPSGYCHVPLWLAQSGSGPLGARVFRLAALDIALDEDALPNYPDEKKVEADVPATEYFQITTEWGNTWRSRALGARVLPLDPNLCGSIKLFDWRFDTYVLGPDEEVRRVTLKAPITRFNFRTLASPGPPRVSRPGNEVLQPAQPALRDLINEPGAASLVIQCAVETDRRDAHIDVFRAEYDQELADLETESAATLDRLRWRLLGIGLATFAATFVGGLVLVRAGLAPLRRLSDAVSQVSEKDFRLPFEERSLPSELRPIVERLTQTLEQLQRAFNREKQATADISHELRTPLAALLTTTDVALRKPRSAEEYRQSLEDCRSIGQQLCQQVERLLQLARLDAGVDALRPCEIDAALLAEQCAALVRPLAEVRQLRLTVHNRGPALLLTDPAKLREVLTNLLHNAVEYNRPHGSIDLTVQRANGKLRVEVRDTGIGIAADAKPNLFQRYFRADPARHSTGLHAGLGLAIVKGYVDLMGGTISVESTPGEGSTFRVCLPAGHNGTKSAIHRQHSAKE